MALPALPPALTNVKQGGESEKDCLTCDMSRNYARSDHLAKRNACNAAALDFLRTVSTLLINCLQRAEYFTAPL